MAQMFDLAPLTRHIDEVGREIVHHLGSQIENVQSKVGTVASDLRLTRDELIQLKAEFQEFVDQANRAAAVQQSQLKAVDLKSQLDREFGHYSVVRRTSIGLLQSFDVGNVSNAVATNVAEELMIQTPRYWLAPALVALAAWSHDRADLAEKSVAEAFARDRHKTSLFFALILRRQGRLKASVRWLRHYFASLDPTALTREFAIILESASYAAFGPEGQELLAERLSTWSKELRNNNEVVEEQISRWVNEITDHQMSLDPDEYPTLRMVCSQWDQLREVLEHVSALPPMLEKYQQVRDFEAPLPTRLEDLLDDILDTLVAEFDEEELPLRREVVYHEAVVEEQGNLAKAQQRADLLQLALEETNDVVSLQTMGAISPGLLGISTQTQRMAIGVAQDDFRTAVGRYCSAYRARMPEKVQFRFDSKHSNFAGTYKFRTVTHLAADGQQKGEELLRDAWHKTMASLIEKAQFKPDFYIKPGAIAAGIALVITLIVPIAGLLAAVIGIGVVWSLGNRKQQASIEEIEFLEKRQKEACQYSQQLLRDALAELADSRLVYAELDATEAPLLDLINGWPTAGKEN